MLSTGHVVRRCRPRGRNQTNLPSTACFEPANVVRVGPMRSLARKVTIVIIVIITSNQSNRSSKSNNGNNKLMIVIMVILAIIVVITTDEERQKECSAELGSHVPGSVFSPSSERTGSAEHP